MASAIPNMHSPVEDIRRYVGECMNIDEPTLSRLWTDASEKTAVVVREFTESLRLATANALASSNAPIASGKQAAKLIPRQDALLYQNMIDRLSRKITFGSTFDSDRLFAAFADDGTKASFKDTLESLACNAETIISLITWLKQIPYDGYFFEAAPFGARDYDTRPFEAVVTEVEFERAVEGGDPTPFAENFVTMEKAVAFPNLNGKSMLIVPTPKVRGDKSDIATFVRTVPIDEQIPFWRLVAKTALQSVATRPVVWLSTHGLGVQYLHVRIDPTPKYYVSEWSRY